MKNLKNVVFWAGIFITILTYILVRPLANLDEIWNFNIARGISNGLVPYKDISMITTPLLSFITAIFLKIFGTEMFITRILAAVLATVNLILISRICKNISVPKPVTNILLIAIAFVLKDYFCLDYNFFIVAIALGIILLEIKSLKKEKQNITFQIFIGLLGGLAICTKQSIGILICFIILINGLFFAKNKSDIKKYLKVILYRAIGIIIPIIIFVIYLLCNSSFKDFMDYCIIGINTFSNKISYVSLVKSQDLLIKILSICIPVVLIISIIINIVTKCLKREDKLLYLLNVYCLPIFAMVYPISDNIHFLIGTLPVFILFVYSIMLLLKKFNKIQTKYILEFIDIISIVWIVVFTMYVELKNFETLSDLSKYSAINNFKNIYVSESLSDSIKNIGDYINNSEKQVYILDSSAAVYMIPINRYNKNYDMFNKGNLGSGGEDSQIEKIKNEDAKYLILNDDYNKNWQTPNKVISYIKENLNRTGNIDVYDVYENKIEAEGSANTPEVEGENSEGSTTEDANINNTGESQAENTSNNNSESIPQ